ncbi:MAG: Ribosomal protein methyltransferase [Acidimicrobiales bacterium]|nr:Ribosomal protein methyltransferase [Acidimicrobiales bacterium]
MAAGDAELAADGLWQARPSAVLEVDLGDGRVRLTADVDDPALVADRWAPTVLVVDDDGYLDAWRTWAAPVRAGRRFVVHPAWVPRDLSQVGGGDDVVVVVDPGRAFGSGSHESTRLALALLEDLVRSSDRVLDVGCGSGVLAVAASLLGAREVVAIDVEVGAVTATEANALANGVGDRVRASTTPLALVDGAYEVVVANIGGGVLAGLAPDLVRCLAPGGGLVLSGMLDDQADAVVGACTGCEEVERLVEEGWAAARLAQVRPR